MEGGSTIEGSFEVDSSCTMEGSISSSMEGSSSRSSSNNDNNSNNGTKEVSFKDGGEEAVVEGRVSDVVEHIM